MKKAILLLAASLGLAAAPGVLAQVTLTINTETPTTFSATISGTLTADAGGNPYYLAIKPNYPASEGVNVPWITSNPSTIVGGITFNGTGVDVFVFPSSYDATYGDCLVWQSGAPLMAGTTFNGTVTITGTFDYSQVTSFALCDGYNVTTRDWNALVDATSSSATAPSITTQPASASVVSGNSTNFTVTATGSTPLYYQWQFNSNNISGANDATYALAAADVADAGYYDVVITNAFGSVTSSVVTLTVTPATPTVDLWPTASAITYGQPLSASSLTDGSAAVDGSFAFATPTSVLNVGSPSEWVIFTPTDTNNYDVISNTVEVTVSPASLTVTATNETIVYGGGFPAFTGTLVGVTNNDNLTVSFYTPAGAQSGAGAYQILPVFNDPNGVLPNYVVTTNVGQLLIEAAPLGVTADNQSRLYGTNNPTFTITYTGLASWDTSASLTSVPVAVSSATAASAAGQYPITVSGGASLNYTFSYTNGTLTITKAPLTVVAANASRSYGATNPVFAVTGNGFVAGDNLGNLAGTLSFAFTDTNGAAVTVDTNTPVGTYDLVPSGLTSVNYNITYTDGTLIIDPAVLQVIANNLTSVYGSPIPALTCSYAGFVNGDGTNVLSGAPELSTTATSSSTVAGSPYVINVDVGTLSATNYVFTDNAGTFTVTPAALTVTATNQTIMYGVTFPAFTGTLVGVTNNDNLTVSFYTPAGPQSGVGSYGILPVFNDPNSVLPNYAVTTNNGTLTVGNATLTVTAASQTRNYGQANAAFSVNYSGFVNSQDASVVSGTPSFVCQDGNGVNVGPTTVVGAYPIIPGGLTAPNYTLLYANGSLTINQATLTVTANAATRTYGATNPVFSATFTGFANSETTNVISGQPALSTTAGLTSLVGGYPITAALGTLSATNYNFTFNTGTLTVSAAPLSGLVQSWERAYGQTNPVFTVTYSGFVNGETTNLVAGGIVYSCLDSNDVPVGTNTWVGTYGITVSTPQTAPNYSITYSAGSLMVTQTVLIASADSQGKAFGTTNPPLTYTLSGFVNNDGTNVVSGTPELSTSAVTNSPVGTYPIEIALGTLSATNYSFSLTNGVLTVAQAALTVTAVNQTRLYGQTNPVLTVQYSGFVDGDDQSILSGSPAVTTAATTNTGVGSYAITVAGGTLVAPNYALSFTNGTLTITPAPLTVVAYSTNRFYGQTNPIFAGSVTGVLNGDDLGISLGTTATAASAVGTYAIVPTLTDPSSKLGNYAVTTNNGTLTVGNATLTVTAVSQTRNYGQANLRSIQRR
jgi:hypothetical protein